MIKLGLGLTLAGALALGACGGDDGGDASISGVVPGDVFAGRSVSVLISGDNTSFDDGSAPTFGDGVTVDDVVVASPTALYVDITVAGDAALGPRDVEVDGLIYDDAFEIVSPLHAAAVQGTAAQGSLVFLTLQSVDFTTPFDTTSTGGGLFEPPTYTNISIAMPDGVSAQISSVEPYTMSLTLLIDATAEPGPLDLDVLSGPVGTETSFRLPGLIDLAERQAVTMVGGEPVSGVIDAPFESELFLLPASEAAFVHAAVFADGTDAAPEVVVLGESGSFAEFLGQDVEFTAVRDRSVYVLVFDGTGGQGSFEVLGQTAVIGDATVAETNGANDAKGQAQTLSLPLTVTDGELDSPSDQDWYEVVIDDGSAGSSIGVATVGPVNAQAPTDTWVMIFPADGEAPIAVSSDADFDETMMSPPLAAGTYFVQVRNTDPEVFTVRPGPYTMSIALTDPVSRPE